MTPRYTPDRISHLNPNEVFVFGSNLQGRHMGGAARTALERFGAVYGQGVGLQGQSYAIPTMQGGVETIRPYVDEFIDFASSHRKLVFYVTRIGCGIAGFKDEDIAPLFYRALTMDNVVLPRQFHRVFRSMMPFPPVPMPVRERLMMHGQTRTLADVAMALNDRHHFRSLEEFGKEFDKTISEYRERGTVSWDAAHTLSMAIVGNADRLFGCDGYLNLDNLVQLVDGTQTTEGDDALNAIYSCREKTKILRLAALLNQIMRYTNVNDFLRDVSTLTTGRHSCGDNSWLDDSFRYPLHFFRQGVTVLWQDILTEGVMDNAKLEKLMFTDHERKLLTSGLSATLREDFLQATGCHPDRYIPNRIGTAPIYAIDPSYNDHCSGGWGKLVKSCGNGIGPDCLDSLYEFRLVRDILERECRESGRYRHIDNYYVPAYDDRLPVFNEWKGLCHFEMQRDKVLFIRNILMLRKLEK